MGYQKTAEDLRKLCKELGFEINKNIPDYFLMGYIHKSLENLEKFAKKYPHRFVSFKDKAVPKEPQKTYVSIITTVENTSENLRKLYDALKESGVDFKEDNRGLFPKNRSGI